MRWGESDREERFKPGDYFLRAKGTSELFNRARVYGAWGTRHRLGAGIQDPRLRQSGNPASRKSGLRVLNPRRWPTSACLFFLISVTHSTSYVQGTTPGGRDTHCSKLPDLSRAFVIALAFPEVMWSKINTVYGFPQLVLPLIKPTSQGKSLNLSEFPFPDL